MATAYLGLGSNLGDRVGNIRAAIDRLSSRHPGIRVECVSSMYETAPIGMTEQPDFINAVAGIETDLSPSDLLHVILGIESEMGRVRTARWGPRVIDIDILLFDRVAVNTPEIIIPHPHMMERAFVMAPLAEIAPRLELPDGRTPIEVLRELGDQGVRKLAEVA